MSGTWLDSTYLYTSNRYCRTYVQGFMDISGGNLIVRNNNLYLTRGDASINGNLLLGYDLSVNGNIYGNTNTVNSLVVSNNISMNGVFAQFNRDVDVPASDLYTVDLTTYLKKTDMTSYSSNNINILTPFYVDADVSLNSRLFLTGDASFGNRLFLGGLTLGKGGGDISYNTAFGYQALYSNTTGSLNTAIGYQALTSNTTGAYNTAIGFQGLFLNTTGGYNTSLGNQTLFYNTTGGQNTAVGRAALLQNTGSNNTAIGYEAGNAGTSNTSGSNNTYIGYQAQANGNNYTKSTALGSGATITASNQVVLGTTTETVRYNKLSPLYTSVPTYTSSDVGFIFSQSSGQVGYSAGTSNLVSISNLALGVYIVKMDMIIFDPTSLGTNSYVNITLKKNATIITFTSKAFGGMSSTVWVNSPLSASGYLTSNGTDSVSVERSSEMGFQAYYYFQYIRVA